MEDSWEGAFEDDISQKRPIEEHLQIMLSFVQEHETLLDTITESTRESIADAPESHYRPARIARSGDIDRVLPADLLVTDNDLLKKVLLVLVFLCDEMKHLCDDAEVKFFPQLMIFGQVPVECSKNIGEARSGDKERSIGKFVPTLQELMNFVDRCYVVCTNTIQQLSSLYNAKERLYTTTFAAAHLQSVFRALGNLFYTLVTLDHIIEQNLYLKECWALYKGMINFVRNNPAEFGTDAASVTKLEKMLVGIDQGIMSGDIFKGCIEQNFENFMDENDQEVFVSVRSNQVFFNELLTALKLIIENSVKVVGSNEENWERNDVIAGMALYALYRQILPPNIQPDSKLHKVMWSIQKRVPLVVLCGKVVWLTAEFINKYAFFDVPKPDPANPEEFRRDYLKEFDANFVARSKALVSKIQMWMVLAETKMQLCLRHEQNLSQFLVNRCDLLLAGISLANRASYLANSCMVMHEVMQVPLSTALLNYIASLIENVKAIEFTFVRKDLAISETIVHATRAISNEICSLLTPIKVRLEMQKTAANKYEVLSAIDMVDSLVKGSDVFSVTRQESLSILVTIIASASTQVITDRDSARLRLFVKKLIDMANISKNCRNACNTSFMLYNLHILGPIIQNIYKSSTEANRLQYIIAAFCDGIRLCEMVVVEEKAPIFLKFRDFLKSAVIENVVQPLCQDTETNLRLHVHTKHLPHMEVLNPKVENLRPLRNYLDIPPLRLLGLLVDIKREVTHYLDMNFYNLTTVALHDWRTYAEMRSIAADKLGLRLMNNFLPMGSLEQGLDILQIMRNIHIFVGRFSYNMNTQMFVEFKPDKNSKHLNTINIQSIAASIRQHGLGMLNNTVNYTYQFLTQKFHIFSQFLFDDYIRAHLSREHRWYKKHRNDEAVNNMYPYEKALKFVKDIRKLGVNEQGKSFLDLFRITVTEIGNALGYVRMVRSASMYYCSEAVKYLPDLEEKVSFEKLSKEGLDEETGINGAGFSPETVRAGKTLDDVKATLVGKFGQGSDYFKVLVEVFQGVLLTDEHEHLRSFYSIIPALCISWTDAALAAKDNMYKATSNARNANTREMYFTDDGFAIGVAYCLAILKQTRKWESMHWQDTMSGKLKQDAITLEEQQRKRAEKEAKIAEAKKKANSFFSFGKKKEEKDLEEDYEDMEEIHSLQTSAKRLEALRRETEQLDFSLSAASIFFKRSDNDT